MGLNNLSKEGNRKLLLLIVFFCFFQGTLMELDVKGWIGFVPLLILIIGVNIIFRTDQNR